MTPTAQLTVETKGGPRVNFSAMFASFDSEDRIAWDRTAMLIRGDEFGVDVESFERWRKSLPKQRVLF